MSYTWKFLQINYSIYSYFNKHSLEANCAIGYGVGRRLKLLPQMQLSTARLL